MLRFSRSVSSSICCSSLLSFFFLPKKEVFVLPSVFPSSSGEALLLFTGRFLFCRFLRLCGSIPGSVRAFFLHSVVPGNIFSRVPPALQMCSCFLLTRALFHLSISTLLACFRSGRSSFCRIPWSSSTFQCFQTVHHVLIIHPLGSHDTYGSVHSFAQLISSGHHAAVLHGIQWEVHPRYIPGLLCCPYPPSAPSRNRPAAASPSNAEISSVAFVLSDSSGYLKKFVAPEV